MKKISLLLSSIAFIGVLTVGIFSFLKQISLLLMGIILLLHIVLAIMVVHHHKFNVNVFKNPPNGGFLNGLSACSIRIESTYYTYLLCYKIFHFHSVTRF